MQAFMQRLRRLLARLYTLGPYPELIERRQALASYVVITAGLLATILVTVLSPDLSEAPPWVIFSVAILALLTGGWWTLRRGNLTPIRWLLPALIGLTAFVPWLGENWLPTMLMLQFTFFVLAAILWPAWGVLVAGALALPGDFVVLTAIYSTISPEEQISLVNETVNIVLFTGLLVTLLYLLAQGWRRGLGYLETEVEAEDRRQRVAEMSAEITERVFRRADEEAILNDAVILVRDRFAGVYHAHIFLIEPDRQYAVLRASTGEVGEELLRRGYRLPVNSQSIIGQVSMRGEPILAGDTDTDPRYHRNELLPDTLAELAVPLLRNNQVTGVLDVQSIYRHAFSSDDIGALQWLANQIAVALDSARLFNEHQHFLEENQRLTQQVHSQMAQIQDLNRQLIRHVWSEHLSRQELAPALTVDFATEAMTPNAEWTPGLTEATRSGQTITGQEAQGGREILAVPLIIRGQVIGAMEFELDPAAPAAESERLAQPEQLARDVADRLALSLESARLYDEAQRLAQREAVINDIGSRLQRTTGIESALLATAQGLQLALNAPRIAIQLGMPPPEPASGSRPAREEGEA